MKKTAGRSLLSVCTLLVGCSFAADAYAQDAFQTAPTDGRAKPAPHLKKPTPQPKPAPKPAEHAKAAGGPPTGAGAGQASNVLRFGAWAVSCSPKTAATDPANCVALISVARDKGDQRRIVIMGLLKRDGTISYFAQTPTTVSIKPGVEVQFDGKAGRHYDYDSCEPALCTAVSPVDGALFDEIVTTPSATIGWTSLAAGPVKIVFPTNGAREALDFLKAQ